MRVFIILSIIFSVYGYSFDDDDTYRIFITDTKGNITREKLTTNKDVSSLDISFATIEAIAPDAFCALPNLTDLYINGNSKFPRVTKELFQCNEKLVHASFIAYNAAQMDRNAFTDLKKLTMLRINEVEVKRIGKDMFVGLDLEILNMVSCSINEIDGDSFSSLPNLKELILGHNMIQSFKPGTFQNLPKLKELHLNKNKIAAITWEQWNPLPKLTSLDFGDNPLTVCDATKIKEYFPIIEYCNLGDAFNETGKAKILEDSKDLNRSIRFINYYRTGD